MCFADYLIDRRARVDAALEQTMPRPPECPELLSEAVRYSLMAGGKRLRPILAIAAAEAVHERLTNDASDAGLATACAAAMPAACALECIHTYSLIHDDLPAMDNDTLRRGRPTSHVVFGEGNAILAGDALLTHAFSILASGAAQLTVTTPMVRTVRAIEVIARAAGAYGMVGGQIIDLHAIGREPATGRTPAIGRTPATGRTPAIGRAQTHLDSGGTGPVAVTLDAASLERMHAMKTGALIRAAGVAGALLAGATDDLAAAIDRYAAEVGLAFQIVDDLLDVESSADRLGKTAGKDAAAGKPTYPALYGIAESRRLADGCITRAKAVLKDAGIGGRLSELAEWVVARTS